MNREQIMDAAGITYRQLSHWTLNGWLHPANDDQVRRGHPRQWPQHEVQVAVAMGHLVRAGLTASAAATLARRLVDAGARSIRVRGVTITLPITTPGDHP